MLIYEKPIRLNYRPHGTPIAAGPFDTVVLLRLTITDLTRRLFSRKGQRIQIIADFPFSLITVIFFQTQLSLCCIDTPKIK
ncbi:hypothetical protein DMI69_22190 [Escherichia coli]|nr:hypothetical protein [Escherichia coli]